jgi:hypothetical protein
MAGPIGYSLADLSGINFEQDEQCAGNDANNFVASNFVG